MGAANKIEADLNASLQLIVVDYSLPDSTSAPTREESSPLQSFLLTGCDKKSFQGGSRSTFRLKIMRAHELKYY